MPNPSALPESVSDGFAAAVVAYLQAREEGRTPTPAEWLDRHPEYATELAAFFDDQAQLEQLAQPLREVGRAAWSVSSIPQDAEVTVAETEPAPVRAAGRCYGDYEVLEELARGGMGVVYKARQKSLNRLVALKVIRAGEMASAADAQRFRQEAETIALLDHPHIVPVYEVGERNGQVFFAMKLIEGGCLANRVSKGAVDKAEHRWAARLVATVARAIHHAHQRGVLHRDLKPSNILLDGQGQPHVTDFGLAKRVHADNSLTQSGAVLGTPSYMAPEQARGDKGQITTVTDVYGLGAVLYTLLTGRSPFQGDTVLDTLKQIQEREPESPRRSNPALARDLETICLKCLQKEPAQRYASAEALAEDLAHWLEDRPIQARRPTPWLRLARWSRRHKPLVGAAAVVGLALTTLAAGLALVAHDRATQRGALAFVAQSALRDSAVCQQQGRLPEALSAARRANDLVARADVDPALKQQAQQRLGDLEMVEPLQRIRLERGTAVRDGHFDAEERDRAYTQAFLAAGWDVASQPAEEVAARIRSTTVATELAAVLDDWAMTSLASRGINDQTWKTLLRVACLADLDTWRTQARQALVAWDWPALQRLAATADVAQLSPATLATLAKALDSGPDGAAAAEALLRVAQRQHPHDFWLNVLMWEHYTHHNSEPQPARLADRLRFASAAVCLRPESPGAHVNLGVALNDAGQMDEAIAEYQEAIRLKKDYAGAHNDLGNALSLKGRLDEAVTEYQEAIRLKKDFVEAHYNLAGVLGKKGRPDAAIIEYQETIRLRKDFAEAHEDLGSVLHDKGRLDAAIAEYQEAIRLKKDFPEAHNNLGIVLREKGRLDAAMAEYRRAIRLRNKYAEAYNNLGVVLSDKGQLDEAIAEYQEAIRLKKDFAEAHSNLGDALRERGRLDAAITECREAIRLQNDLPGAHYNLGNGLRDKGQLEEAITEYQEAIRLKKDYAEAHSNLGNVLGEKGQLDKAITEYRDAIRLKKDFAEAHYGLGIALCRKGRQDQAINEYQEAIRLKKDFAQAHYGLAVALTDRGQPDAAIPEYRRAIALDPRFTIARIGLGRALARRGDMHGAMAEFRRATALDPKDARWHLILAVALTNSGQPDAAIPEYRRAVALNPKKAEIHYDFGNALLLSGDRKGAIAEFHQGIALNPDYPEAYCNLGWALRGEGRFVESFNAFRRGHALGSQRPGWLYPSAHWLHQAEEAVPLASRLTTILRGTDQPHDNMERVAVATVYYAQNRYLAAARLYADALSGSAALANERIASHCYDAAACAALAGCGKGRDGPTAASERAGWRQQALGWLKADLALRAKRGNGAAPSKRQAAAVSLRLWQLDSDLAGVRDPAELKKLAPAEQADWQKLWADVAALLAKTRM